MSPAPSCIIAHDLGTTGNKATLYDAEGRVLARAYVGYETTYPQTGWAEQEARQWWDAVRDCTHRLLRDGAVAPADVAVVAFSGMMQACLPVDERGQPLRPAMIWADQRATAQAARLEERLGMATVHRITGHRITPTLSGAKIAWVREHEPEIYARAYKFLHVKDFIVQRLTERFVTDRSDASGMNLYDLAQGTWSAPILDVLGIDVEKLPAIYDSTAIVGEVTRAAAAEVGLRPGTPVVIGAGDGVSATVGAGAVREGLAYNYVGSSSWIAFSSPRPLDDPGMKIFNYAHAVPGQFVPCGTMQAAGGSYQWLRRQVCTSEAEGARQAGVDPYEVMNLAAEQSPPGANGLIFLPYLMGERTPYWNPRARGAFIGLTLRHTRADLIRATLEGITLNLRLILDTYREAGAAIHEMRAIGGGAKGRFWRQMMADVYGLPVLCPRQLEEATALGAAIIGGVGVGLFPGFAVVDQFIEIVDRHLPDPQAHAVYQRLLPIFRDAYTALRPIYEQLHAFAG